MPHKFLAEACKKARIELPEPGQYGCGIVFLPRNPTLRRRIEERFEQIVQSEGQTRARLAHRADATTPCSATPRSRASRSCARCSSAAIPTIADELAFERKLYVIRKRAYTEIRTSTLEGAASWYVASLSHKTLVYKGMLLTEQLAPYFPDLQRSADGDGARAGALALQHQHVPELGSRASVSLRRAQRRDQHRARQRQLDARARSAVRVATRSATTCSKILPIINPNGRDSAMFDNTLELLVLAGRSLPHAMMMMIPEPWSNHQTHGRREARVLPVPLVA